MLFYFLVGRVSLQVVMEGEPKGVAGQNGVPMADRLPDGALFAARPSLDPAASSGKIARKARNASQIHNRVQKSGIETSIRTGTVHGIKSSRNMATRDVSTEWYRVSKTRWRRPPLVSEGNDWCREKWSRRRSFSAHFLSSQEESCRTSSILYRFTRK